MYDGEWLNSKQHGRGIATNAKGQTVDSMWREGKRVAEPAPPAPAPATAPAPGRAPPSAKKSAKKTTPSPAKKGKKKAK